MFHKRHCFILPEGYKVLLEECLAFLPSSKELNKTIVKYLFTRCDEFYREANPYVTDFTDMTSEILIYELYDKFDLGFSQAQDILYKIDKHFQEYREEYLQIFKPLTDFPTPIYEEHFIHFEIDHPILYVEFYL